MWLQDIVLPPDKVGLEEGRRDPCGTEEEERWRVCYGQIEQLAKELENASRSFQLLADAQGRGGRLGQGFHCANMEPLLDRTAHSLIRKPSEILREEPLCQSDPSNSYHHYPGTSTSASSPGQPLSF
jgi:hypothetical protein